jgi:hypothetical protein
METDKKMKTDLYNSLTYKKLQNYISMLKSYHPPKDVYPFLVIGTLLGFSISYIYKQLTTVKSRQAMWNKLRIEWNDFVETKVLQSKSKWQRFKNRVNQLLGRESKNHFKNYYESLEKATKSLVNFYECLFKNRIIKSSQVKSVKIEDNDDDSDDSANESNDEKTHDRVLERVLERSPIEFFGKKFKQGKLSSLGILLHVITVDYAIAGRKHPIPPDCSESVSGLDRYLENIKYALIGLKEHRGKEKIKKIIELWTILKTDMTLNFDESYTQTDMMP